MRSTILRCDNTTLTYCLQHSADMLHLCAVISDRLQNLLKLAVHVLSNMDNTWFKMVIQNASLQLCFVSLTLAKYIIGLNWSIPRCIESLVLTYLSSACRLCGSKFSTINTGVSLQHKLITCSCCSHHSNPIVRTVIYGLLICRLAFLPDLKHPFTPIKVALHCSFF